VWGSCRAVWGLTGKSPGGGPFFFFFRLLPFPSLWPGFWIPRIGLPPFSFLLSLPPFACSPFSPFSGAFLYFEPIGRPSSYFFFCGRFLAFPCAFSPLSFSHHFRFSFFFFYVPAFCGLNLQVFFLRTFSFLAPRPTCLLSLGQRSGLRFCPLYTASTKICPSSLFNLSFAEDPPGRVSIC